MRPSLKKKKKERKKERKALFISRSEIHAEHQWSLPIILATQKVGITKLKV
jgi:hypothetical protein